MWLALHMGIHSSLKLFLSFVPQRCAFQIKCRELCGLLIANT